MYRATGTFAILNSSIPSAVARLPTGGPGQVARPGRASVRVGVGAGPAPAGDLRVGTGLQRGGLLVGQQAGHLPRFPRWRPRWRAPRPLRSANSSTPVTRGAAVTAESGSAMTNRRIEEVRGIPRRRPAGRPPARPAMRAADRRPDDHRLPGVGHPADLQPGQMREQDRQELTGLRRDLPAADGINACQRRRHDKMKWQRRSRVTRSWQTSASYRNLAATTRRHAAPAPHRDKPAGPNPGPIWVKSRNASQNSRKSPKCGPDPKLGRR